MSLYTHIYDGIHIGSRYIIIYITCAYLCRVKNEITKVEFRQKKIIIKRTFMMTL